MSIPFLISAVLAFLVLLNSTPFADIFEYDLPELSGDYCTYYCNDAPSWRTTYITYGGTTARLEHIKVYINGSGDGTECYEDHTGELIFSDWLRIEICVGSSEHENFVHDYYLAWIDSPAHAFEDTTWLNWHYAEKLTPLWYEEVILHPGDSLNIRINATSAGWVGCAWGYTNLYDFHL